LPGVRKRTGWRLRHHRLAAALDHAVNAHPGERLATLVDEDVG
jgi:hypothetical protein